VTFATDPVTGKRTASLVLNPLPGGPDRWTVTSEGILAIVREHDYHIDWISPDGTKTSSGALPFEWRGVSDDEKRARIDSIKREIDSRRHTNDPIGLYVSGGSPDGRLPPDSTWARISFVPMNMMRDSISPLREDSWAVLPDRAGNVWILATAEASGGGPQRYDVVSPTRGLFQRVEKPVDGVIIGFGERGAVYITRRVTDGWILERRRLR
jgi:hypothetical protein